MAQSLSLPVTDHTHQFAWPTGIMKLMLNVSSSTASTTPGHQTLSFAYEAENFRAYDLFHYL